MPEKTKDLIETTSPFKLQCIIRKQQPNKTNNKTTLAQRFYESIEKKSAQTAKQ